mmetsp:Transcript_27074/g.31504  ORF Transcript_27074/g.31504 Transcript_27074/m.31504 type:complete len:94 (+) Transcript_27074:1723-2004(+)
MLKCKLWLALMVSRLNSYQTQKAVDEGTKHLYQQVDLTTLFTASRNISSGTSGNRSRLEPLASRLAFSIGRNRTIEPSFLRNNAFNPSKRTCP